MDIDDLDVPDIIKERYHSSFEAHLGVCFKKYADSECIVELDIKPHHLNIGGTTHGGIIEALADIALSGAVTCNFINKAETVVTMQMNVYFLKPGHEGDTLRAHGKIEKRGRTICYVSGEITNQDGKLIARADGNWFIKAPKDS